MADNLTVKTFALGMALVALGAVGFHELDGMVAADAGGDPWVNAVYCSVITLTTVGYGDICPAAPALEGKVFLIALSFAGLGFFCGPIMDLTSSWSNSVPGGKLGVVVATLGLGVAMFTKLEGWAPMDAVYYSTITGTTIGYGDMYPQTDNGKLAAPSALASKPIVPAPTSGCSIPGTVTAFKAHCVRITSASRTSCGIEPSISTEVKSIRQVEATIACARPCAA